MPIDWSAVTRRDEALIRRIVKRAVKAGYVPKSQTVDFQMDVEATHISGCPLRLADWLAADEFNFAHDVGGIRRHLNRETGELMDYFLPRFSVPQKSSVEAKAHA